jgi:phosphate transport system ATP-binding protein
MSTAAPPAAEHAIRTRGLSLWYGTFQALIDVSLDVKPNRVTALIGPSGCGKTTLLRCFNRMNERFGNVKTTGEVRILGRNIYDPEVSLTALRKSVGMVFQRPNPLPISIYENVIFGLRVHTARGDSTRAEQDAMVEPCSALDAEGVEGIEELIQALRVHYTILIVTHNLGQARRASDECVFMLLGRMVEHAPTLELFLAPRQKETEMYVTGRYG